MKIVDESIINPDSAASIDGGITVLFSQSGITASWSDDYESLLEFAEEQGLTPDFSCRAGICNTCHCALTAGEVEYIDDPLVEPEPGYALPCISIPKTNIVIDI